MVWTISEAVDIKKRWQEYTKELYKRDLNDPENQDGVILTQNPTSWNVKSRSITMNKASVGDEIPTELFQIVKHDAIKVLHSTCQQIWKTQQWPQDWKTSIFIPILKKGNAKKCSNHRTLALISHVNKVMLKILQARPQQYVT